MKVNMEIIDRMGIYEKCGFTRDQAIHVIEIEEMMTLSDKLSEVVKVGSSDKSDTQKGTVIL
jgi:hypothetical protein